MLNCISHYIGTCQQLSFFAFCMRENFHQLHFSSTPVFSSASASIYPLEPHACESHFSYLRVVASSWGYVPRPLFHHYGPPQIYHKPAKGWRGLALQHAILYATQRTPVRPPDDDASSRALSSQYYKTVSFEECYISNLSRSTMVKDT